MAQSEKIKFLVDSLLKRGRSSHMACPSCGSSKATAEDRKFLVVELRRCLDCRLLYRVPTDSIEDNRRFYQKNYKEGFTTEVPTDAELEKMTASRFADTGKSYAYYIDVLRALGLGAGARVFDYGCSWGYGSWQLGEAGFDVASYEISAPRAAFARAKLGVNCLPQALDVTALGALAQSFDVFFSAHVLEHVSQPARILDLGRGLVKPGGFMVLFTPNGAMSHRKRHPQNWHTNWGKAHPFMIDDEFCRHAFVGRPLLLAASPIDFGDLAAFAQGTAAPATDLIGAELGCVVRC